MFLLARWLLLIWTVWFFALFLPGHNRGMLLLPGETSEAGCPMCVTGTLVVQRDDQDTPTQAPGKPCGRCAVCQFMATIANVQAPPSQIPGSWLIGWRDPLPEPSVHDARQIVNALHIRPPPMG